MGFYTNFPKYPTAIFDDIDYPTQADDTDTVYADLVNALKEELQACFAELGTLPKGVHASVKARIEALEAQLKVELDYFEYPTDEAAKLAYVASVAYGPDILTGGTASADSEEVGSEADKACNNDGGTTRWNTPNVVYPHWWKYDLGAAVTKTVRKLRIWPRAAPDAFLKNFTLHGSNNNSDWTLIYTGLKANTGVWEDFTFANGTAYRYYKINITDNWDAANPNYCQVYEFEMMELVGVIEVSSEDTIIEQGLYSLKVVAPQTTSLNETITRTVDPVKDLTGKILITLWVRSDRTGENFKVEFHDSGGNTISYTVNILIAATWEKKEINVSAVADGDKDSIDEIKYTILNAAAAAEMYLDNNFAT